MVWSVSFGNNPNRDTNHDIALTFGQDEWSGKTKTLYMKHHLITGDVNSKIVSCKYYVLSGIESWKLNICW